MASTYRYITITLSSLGSNLGPNFNLTTDVGNVSPPTVTREQLLDGIIVTVDDTATFVTITSVGACSTVITKMIDCNGPSFFTIEYWAELYGTEWTVYAESMMGQASLSEDVTISGILMVEILGGSEFFNFSLTIPAGQGSANSGPKTVSAEPFNIYNINISQFIPENLTNVTGTPNVTDYIIRYLFRQ